MSLVSVSPMTADKFAEGMVTAKLVASRVAISFRLSPVFPVVPVVVPL